MRSRCKRLAGLVLVVLCVRGIAGGQAPPADAHPGSSAAEQQSQALAGLSAGERTRFDAAQRAFTGQRFAEALDGFRPLLSEVQAGSPASVLIAKFAAESAINTGDPAFASRTLEPIEQADANDWQAASLLARAYAESGDRPRRDREIARLLALHQQAADPQFAKREQFLLERIALPQGSMRVWYSLVPWGPYHVYVYARVYDQAEQQVLRLTLESGDFDQPFFAKQHPDLAAKGERAFSLDSYGQDRQAANGQVAQTHGLITFYSGQPSYDTVRAAMIQAATANLQAASGRPTQ